MDESTLKLRFQQNKIKEHYLYVSPLEANWLSWKYNHDYLRKDDSSSFVRLNSFFIKILSNAPMSIPTIYISGDIQIGKTRRCIAFLNEIISKLEKNVSYLNWCEFLREITKNAEYQEALTKTNLSLLDDIFKNSYVIVIDDFKYVKNKYITLVIDYIEQRLQMHKPIIFVSNFTLAQNHKDFTKFLYGEKNHIDIFFDRLELAIDGNFFPLLPKDNKL